MVIWSCSVLCVTATQVLVPLEKEQLGSAAGALEGAAKNKANAKRLVKKTS